ncbi:MAG: hypothetical protein HY298_14375 [Verrucomicrobia bacterium]|nr:hypothetical protein [Verrucomicrobiota bacterium]
MKLSLDLVSKQSPGDAGRTFVSCVSRRRPSYSGAVLEHLRGTAALPAKKKKVWLK